MSGSISFATESALGDSQLLFTITTGLLSLNAALKTSKLAVSCHSDLTFLVAIRENKPKKGGICVANHTSPIDVVILCNDGGYAMVGRETSISSACFEDLFCLNIRRLDVCLSGGSGPWRSDGGASESHGAVLSSRLV